MKTAPIRVRLRSSLSCDRGVELVEMALVIPLLLTLIIGLIWVARGFNTWQTMTRAAREGARVAVMTNCATCGNTLLNSAQVRQNFVDPALLASHLNPAQVQSYSQSVQWMDPGGSPPQQCGIVITFSYPFQLIVPFTSVNFTTVNIPTAVQMRLENQPTGGTCP